MRLFLRPVYRSYRLSFGLLRWCQQRLTPAGVTVLVALMAAAIMGPDTEDNVAYQAFTLLFCLLAVGAAFALWFRISMSVVRVLPRFGSVGCPLAYTVRVRNLSSRSQAGLTLIDQLADPKASFSEWYAAQRAERKEHRSFRFSAPRRIRPLGPAAIKEATIPSAEPQEEVEVRLELTPLRRGVLRFESVKIGRSDPLGLFRALRRLPLHQTTLVLPRRYRLPPLDLPGTLKYQDGGVSLASHVGQSEEFIALRDYRYGDPLRHIHWRSWAKAGKPVVKEFEDEFFVRHALVLDTFIENPNSELFEEAVSVAASFACALQSQESLLDLLFVGPDSYCFTSGRGLAHTDQMLEILASVRACSDQPFATLERLVLNHVGAVSGCICVLLAWDEGRRNFIEKLKRMGLPLSVYVLVEPGAPAQALDPGPMRDQPDRFKILHMDKIEQDLTTVS